MGAGGGLDNCMGPAKVGLHPALPHPDPDVPQTDAPCPHTQQGLPFPASPQLELGRVPGLILQII